MTTRTKRALKPAVSIFSTQLPANTLDTISETSTIKAGRKRQLSEPTLLQSRFSVRRKRDGAQGMPLVKIDIIKGARTPEEIKKLADVIQVSLIWT